MFKREYCYWYHRVRVCDALNVLPHECTKKCSFYETEEEYQERQARFRERENIASKNSDFRKMASRH